MTVAVGMALNNNYSLTLQHKLLEPKLPAILTVLTSNSVYLPLAGEELKHMRRRQREYHRQDENLFHCCTNDVACIITNSK